MRIILQRRVSWWFYGMVMQAAAALLLGGCASINPYGVPEGEGAQLRNRTVVRGGSTLYLAFSSGKTEQDGWKQFFPGKEAGNRTIYRIPAGEVRLGARILYFHDGEPVGSVGDALRTSAGYLFSRDARRKLDTYIDHYEILVVNHLSLGGDLAGMKVDAREGEVYQLNCRIAGGRAWVWVEDSRGRRVSNEAPGVFLKHRSYHVWVDLPDP